MINKLFRAFAGLMALLLLATPAALAQTATEAPEMADALRANGKIYVVVGVVVIIVGGLLLYLLALDRKVSRLEKEIK